MTDTNETPDDVTEPSPLRDLYAAADEARRSGDAERAALAERAATAAGEAIHAWRLHLLHLARAREWAVLALSLGVRGTATAMFRGGISRTTLRRWKLADDIDKEGDQ